MQNSRSETLDYLIAVQTPTFRISDDEFATESAFAAHLRELRKEIGVDFERLVLVAPQMMQSTYDASIGHLAVISANEGITLLPAHRIGDRAVHFWFKLAPRLWRSLHEAVGRAGIVHSGLSDDIGRPMMALVNLIAWKKGKPIIFIVDIDFRRDTRRYYKLGIWGLKSYLTNTLIYDPLKWIQVWFASRNYSLLLLKSRSMVHDFGRGRDNVKYLVDAVHSENEIIGSVAADARRERVMKGNPLQLIFFGRFVPYKGLDSTIEAVRYVRARGSDVRLTLLGAGEALQDLRAQVTSHDLEDAVTFVDQVPYGDRLFELIDAADLAIATPQVEDTPRAALDAMARGLPIVAFDIEYFASLSAESGAVVLTPWPDVESLANEIIRLDSDRARIAEMSTKAIAYALANTQPKWLSRRMAFTRKIMPEK